MKQVKSFEIADTVFTEITVDGNSKVYIDADEVDYDQIYALVSWLDEEVLGVDSPQPRPVSGPPEAIVALPKVKGPPLNERKAIIEHSKVVQMTGQDLARVDGYVEMFDRGAIQTPQI